MSSLEESPLYRAFDHLQAARRALTEARQEERPRHEQFLLDQAAKALDYPTRNLALALGHEQMRAHAVAARIDADTSPAVIRDPQEQQ